MIYMSLHWSKMMTKLTDEVWQDFYDFVLQNAWDKNPKSKAELAKKYGVRINTISRWIDKFKLHKYIRDGRSGVHSHNKVDRNLQIYEDYWKGNKTLAKLGAEHNMSRQRVHTIVRTMEQHRLNGQL